MLPRRKQSWPLTNQEWGQSWLLSKRKGVGHQHPLQVGPGPRRLRCWPIVWMARPIGYGWKESQSPHEVQTMKRSKAARRQHKKHKHWWGLKWPKKEEPRMTFVAHGSWPLITWPPILEGNSCGAQSQVRWCPACRLGPGSSPLPTNGNIGGQVIRGQEPCATNVILGSSFLGHFNPHQCLCFLCCLCAALLCFIVCTSCGLWLSFQP